MKKFITISEEDAVTKVNWDANSNMNDFKTPGVYDIYGERTVNTDNLPIMNIGGGHSISCKLTVVASTLQPKNDEICITQFLQLSNRIGGEGATYVRTYNENNNGLNGWSAWQKQLGIVETLINTENHSFDDPSILDGNAVVPVGGGLKSFTNNGIYSGVYIGGVSPEHMGNGSYKLTSLPPLIETFVLVVINNYAISGQIGTPISITQLKYAVDAITNISTVKKRVNVGGATSWSEWEDI